MTTLLMAATWPAVAAEPGQKLWEFQTGGAVHACPAIGFDGTVYVGSWDHSVYALNGATGEKRWEYQTVGAVVSSPAIGADGTLYVGSMDRKVYALHGVTGRKRWEFQTEDGVSSSPAVGLNGTVYVGSDDGKVYALQGTSALGQATSAPIVAVVSNVDPARFPAWCWQAGGEAACALESTAVLGPNVSWQTVRQYPVGLTSAPYVETNPLQAPRFYRLRGDPNARFTTSGLACGWWYEHAVGSRHRIEYSAPSTDWTNWVVLTDLVLPESPHLFLDQASVGEPARVYRTTTVP